MMAGPNSSARQQVVDAHLGNALDLAQAFGDFIGRWFFRRRAKVAMMSARQALPGRALDGGMKGKPNLAL
jgi:hypothetical protein